MAAIDEREVKFKQYGNNYFQLRAANKGFIDGVLTELPAISMSTDWVAGPMESINSFIDETFNNAFVEYLGSNANAANGGYKRYLAVGENNAKVYNGSSRLTFDLKWRVYPGQKIGTYTTSTANECLSFIKHCVPSDDMSSISITDVIRNVGVAADGAVELMKNATSEYEAADWKMDKDMQVDKALARFKENQNRVNGIDENGNKTGKPEKAYNEKDDAQKIGYENLTNKNEEDLKVFNNEQIRGAALFYLCIYYKNVFNDELPVNIKNFTATPSKEWNKDAKNHYYWDFSVTCEMNEIPSVPGWHQKLIKF